MLSSLFLIGKVGDWRGPEDSYNFGIGLISTFVEDISSEKLSSLRVNQLQAWTKLLERVYVGLTTASGPVSSDIFGETVIRQQVALYEKEITG